MTVTGPILPHKLGITSMHEHIIADCSFSGKDFNKKYDDINLMIKEVKLFYRAGGKTIVEQTSIGLGQDITALFLISKKSKIQIVASTGFYRECVYPYYVYLENTEKIAKRLINDIQKGIDGTDIRPGIIAELASEDGKRRLSGAEEKIFRAAAYANAETGLAISTHAWEGNLAHEQIKILTDEGVKSE